LTFDSSVKYNLSAKHDDFEWPLCGVDLRQPTGRCWPVSDRWLPPVADSSDNVLLDGR